MVLSEIVFLGIVLYLLYRFVFNFLLPIIRTTRHVRQQFRNMQDTMHNQQAPPGPQFFHQDNGQSARPNQSSGNSTAQKSASSDKMGEYIDFEEIK